MPTAACLGSSMLRVQHSRNLVAWQKRQITKVSDPRSIAAYEIFLDLLEGSCAAMIASHKTLELLSKQSLGNEEA